MIAITDDLINKCRADPNSRNWNVISSLALSESFIREFQDKLNWNNMSCYQTFRESFIKEFQDKVQWKNISKHQQLSESFIEEFQNKLNWNNYLLNTHAIPSIVYKYRNNSYKFSKHYKFYKSISTKTLNRIRFDNLIDRYYAQQETKKIFKIILPKECIGIIINYL